MKQVKCIDCNGTLKTLYSCTLDNCSLTIGKVYDVISESKTGYSIFSDKLGLNNYHKFMFEEVKSNIITCPDCKTDYVNYSGESKCPMCENKMWEPSKGVNEMNTCICSYCGRTLNQSDKWIYKLMIFGIRKNCQRCQDGFIAIRIAHAKSVRLAWKYREITRRRCDSCKYNCGKSHFGKNMCHQANYDTVRYRIPCYSVPDDAQCPRWERL